MRFVGTGDRIFPNEVSAVRLMEWPGTGSVVSAASTGLDLDATASAQPTDGDFTAYFKFDSVAQSELLWTYEPRQTIKPVNREFDSVRITRIDEADAPSRQGGATRVETNHSANENTIPDPADPVALRSERPAYGRSRVPGYGSGPGAAV